MKINYYIKKLEIILNDERLIKKYYGHIYHNLLNRLTELEICNYLDEISYKPSTSKLKLIAWLLIILKKIYMMKIKKGEDILYKVLKSFKLYI